MKHTGVFFVFALAVTAVAAQQPDSVMWRNGAWFDGTGFITRVSLRVKDGRELF